MFVKVVYENGKDTFIQECSKVNITSFLDDNSSILIDMGDTLRLQVQKDADTEVYIMNNEGKTIDMYRWETKKGIDG